MTLFEGTINGDDLRSILDTATVVVDECRVFFQDDRIRIRGTDPADVSLVVIDISEEVFENVSMHQGNVCWDFVEMTDMVNTAGKDTEVKLIIQDYDVEIDILDLNFGLSLIDPDSLDRDRQKPELDLPAEVVMESSAFIRGINAANLVADHVEFGIDEEESAFYMMARGDTNRVIMKRKKQDLITLTLESTSSMYSVNYLTEICSAIPDDTEIRMNFGEDYPAEISYDIIDGNTTVTYFLSPRLTPES